jgi:hypothetical protein
MQRSPSAHHGSKLMFFRRMMTIFAWIALQVLLPVVWAQTANPTGQSDNSRPSENPRPAAPAPVSPPPVVVANVGEIKTTTWTELGRTVTVAVKGLRDWAKTNGNDVRSLRLYLAGHPLSKSPTLISLSEEYLNFSLKPDFSDKEDRTTWIDILQEARRSEDGSIPISVGSQTSIQPFDSRQYVRLNVYPRYTTVVVVGLAILLVALFYLGWRSDMLRDAMTGRPPQPAKSPFSLGRMQMAWWFYVVVAAFLYIWLLTGQANTLTASVLALIGISAGTGLAAIFVDQQKASALASQRTSLVIEQKALQDRIAELQAGGAPATGSPLDSELQSKKSRLTEVNASIATLPAQVGPTVSAGFIDLLRDGDGISFHRFQIVVWTIVLGVIFIRAVAKDLTMPEFDTTLLGLMGLSAGTYIGFKFPEKPKQ